jgi:hypothetical protein
MLTKQSDQIYENGQKRKFIGVKKSQQEWKSRVYVVDITSHASAITNNLSENSQLNTQKKSCRFRQLFRK